MADVVRYTGTVTVNGETLVNGVEVTIDDAYEVLTAEQAFGEAAAPKELGPRGVSGSMRWRYDDGAGFTALNTLFQNGTEFALVCVPVTGSGKNTFTVNIKLNSRPLSFKAGTMIMCSANWINTDNLGLVITPALVLTPVAGTALAAQVGVSATVATFAATGGTGTMAYTCTGLGASALVLGSANGVLNGTPAAGMQGVYNVTVTATDAGGTEKTITRTYVLTIAAA